jgi:hypothetical protein
MYINFVNRNIVLSYKTELYPISNKVLQHSTLAFEEADQSVTNIIACAGKQVG